MDTSLFPIELYYASTQNDLFDIIPMSLQNRKGTVCSYKCSLLAERSGLQHLNVRLRPADEVLQDLHPGFIKWTKEE